MPNDRMAGGDLRPAVREATVPGVNSLWLVVVALCVFALAYRYYAAFIAAKVLMLDDRRVAPPGLERLGRCGRIVGRRQEDQGIAVLFVDAPANFLQAEQLAVEFHSSIEIAYA